MRFSSKFRSLFAEKLMDLGNFSLVALTIGQLAIQEGFATEIFILGIILWISCVSIGLAVLV